MLDMEDASIENDIRFDAHAARALGRNERGATAGTTSHRNATASFPNPHAGGRHYRLERFVGRIPLA